MKDNSIAIVFAGLPKMSSEDEEYPFVVNRHFYYLTGIEQENSVLLVVKGLGVNKFYLFIDPFNPVKERWTGKRLTNDEAREKSDIQNVYSRESLDSILPLILDKVNPQFGLIERCYIDLSDELKIGRELNTKKYAETFKEQYKVEIEDLYPEVTRLRMVKSEEEIAELKKAIDKTNIGLNKIIANLRSGMYEYELADIFEFNGREKGKDNLAFDTIVASGKNATCLHYPTQDAKIKEGDVVLFDLGYRHNLYCADISRCYPVDGTFTNIQRQVYEAVLNCNKAVIAFIKEGLTLSEVHAFSVNYMQNECVRVGLIKPDDDVKKYYYHSVTHHLGLDTHDASLRDLPLERGNVITVEPGLYFPELNIGVRIEDDVLVTAGRAEVLSASIIKEVADIVKLLKTRK